MLWVRFPGPEDRKTRDPSLEHLQSGGSNSRKTLPLLHVSPGPGLCEGRARQAAPLRAQKARAPHVSAEERTAQEGKQLVLRKDFRFPNLGH